MQLMSFIVKEAYTPANLYLSLDHRLTAALVKTDPFQLHGLAHAHAANIAKLLLQHRLGVSLCSGNLTATATSVEMRLQLQWRTMSCD